MTKKKQVVLLRDESELKTVLVRMTRKTLNYMFAESGVSDFRDEVDYFRFSCIAIANEIGGSRTNIAKLIQSSGLSYVTQSKYLYVWLDDLPERLESFRQSKADF